MMKVDKLFHISLLLFTCASLQGAEDKVAWMMHTNSLSTLSAPTIPSTPLPNVLVLGDSISIGYTPFLQKRFAGSANVSRPNCNCCSTRHYLDKNGGMKAWVGTNHWDVITVNCGCWDYCYLRGHPFLTDHYWEPDEAEKKMTPLRRGTSIRSRGYRLRTNIPDYMENLRQILTYLKSTGATVIFALSTPCPSYEQDDRCGLARAYNEVAGMVCKELGVTTVDLYSVGEKNYDNQGDGTHYNEAGSDALAAALEQEIRKVLAIPLARPTEGAADAGARFALPEVKSGTVTGSRFETGVVRGYRCWASEGAKDGEAAVYVFLEWKADDVREPLVRLMAAGEIPPGIVISTDGGCLPASAGGSHRSTRACSFDQPGTEFPSALADELVPAAEKLLGVKASPSPDLHFIAGASSGGIAAWNACWYRNDWFRRCYCNSPTFSNMRGGNQLMPLVRKCETRPIRAYVTCGTFEPDYFFGDSYLVAEDAVSALRFAGYETRFERLEHWGHGAKWSDKKHLETVLAWLFEDWRTKPVSVATNPLRVRDATVKGSTWTACGFAMPAPVREARSSDRERVYSVAPDCRFVMSGAVRLAPLELAWNATRVGGTALAVAEDDRIWVATELGVQGVVSFGLTDVVLPLPGDLPCDNVALVGTNLYASSGSRVFHRYVQHAATDPTKAVGPSTPGYADGFWYSREHEPSGGIAELLGSYVTAGRIAGVVSVLSDADYKTQFDCAGWADYDGREPRKMAPDTLFAIFSMTKTFTGAALMCAIDEGKLSLDDEVAKFLPEFADVKMKDGAKPKRALTLRDLTSHVSGFRGGYHVIDRDIPLREVARHLAAQPLAFQPGETFAYGNSWICTAAACLEVAVGEPYEKYLQRKVLDPLGMKDTTFWPTEEQLKRLVKAYNSDDTRLRPAADACAEQLKFPKKAKVYPAASGGLFSTPQDMIRFSQMLAHHGTWKDQTIISRKTFDTVFAVKQTPTGIAEPYTCGSWLYGDWFGHEGAMRTDQRANLKTGHSRVFFIQTENRAGSAFFQLKRDWHFACDKAQGTPPTAFRD